MISFIIDKNLLPAPFIANEDELPPPLRFIYAAEASVFHLEACDAIRNINAGIRRAQREMIRRNATAFDTCSSMKYEGLMNGAMRCFHRRLKLLFGIMMSIIWLPVIFHCSSHKLRACIQMLLLCEGCVPFVMFQLDGDEDEF